MRKYLVLIIIGIFLASSGVAHSDDLYHNILPKIAVNPASVNDNTATTGAIIDRLGYNSVTFIIQVGANADNTSLTPSIDECDAANCSDAATATTLIGTIAGATVASGTNAIKSVGYNGYKRYVRLTLTPGATNSDYIFYSAAAILGHPQYPPAQ